MGKTKKRGLVISGGGAKGAFGGGVLEYLIKVKGIDWDVYVGTSTGNLLTPSTAAGEIDILKEKYCNISTNDVYSVNPFTKKGKLNIWNAVWRIVRKKMSLGEAAKLRKLIEDFFTKEDYARIRTTGKKLYSCVTNYSKSRVEYKSNYEYEWEDYCDWMLASASVPIVFEPVKKDGCLYLDGGVLMHVPMEKALEQGCDEIDVIVLRPENVEISWVGDDMLDVLMKTESLMLDQGSVNDVTIGLLEGEKDTVKINIYYPPYKLTDNSVVFNKEQMREWWALGYKTASECKQKNLVLKKHGLKYRRMV